MTGQSPLTQFQTRRLDILSQDRLYRPVAEALLPPVGSLLDVTNRLPAIGLTRLDVIVNDLGDGGVSVLPLDVSSLLTGPGHIWPISSPSHGYLRRCIGPF